ncbi:hypothetical protein [Cellulomonas endophytica]|uniref:hypothetical protein n=1 Tax=Cellulomonas endophytica TaxID=2494735 RepID=UPI001010F189|nr:hypothetical protein [Cellulomonas endophytica]
MSGPGSSDGGPGDDEPVGGPAVPGGREPAVLGGVAVAEAPAEADAVRHVLRRAVEDVVAACVGVDLTWWVQATTVADDLADPRPGLTGRDGLDWAFLAERGAGAPLRTMTAGALATALVDHPEHPQRPVAEVHAAWPVPTAAGPVGGLTVAVHVQRWAMYGGGADLVRVTDRLVPWLLDAATTLGAGTGFVTLDRVRADDAESPWERVVGSSPGRRDLRRRLWGHGWGTLLGPEHLRAVGGEAALRALPGIRLRPAGDLVWATLGDDLAAVTPGDVARLRAVLEPALAPGTRTVEEFRREVAETGSPERYVV